jgi:hypothetical protein
MEAPRPSEALCPGAIPPTRETFVGSWRLTMHPGFYWWWSTRGREHCGHHGHDAHAAHGFVPGEHAWGHGHKHGPHFSPGFDHDPGSAFGVRRPLRFLAHKLELNEQQVAQFAALLDDLKTERQQAAVDQRRRISALAEALESSSFDEAKAKDAGDEQIKSAERVRQAVERALKKMHASLDDEQRKKLAYMLRTGVLSL